MDGPPVDILYEQGPCVVVNKPSGLLTQAPPGIESLEFRLKTFLKARDNKTGNTYLGVPHRLDRPVTGAIVFARNVRACRRLSDQFSGRTVGKTYWACVSGRVEPATGAWQDWLRKVPGEARVEVVAEDHPEGREARLRYRMLGETVHGSWLEIELETGRTHQIRIQAASRGYPVLGDASYGSLVAFGSQPNDVRLRGIALHARCLNFMHPMAQTDVAITAPLPEAWSDLALAIDDGQS